MICRFKDRLPTDSNEFLWGTGNVMASVSDDEARQLRREELPDGPALALVAVGVARVGERRVFVAGGQRLDREFLASLVLPAGMRVLLYRNLEPVFSPRSMPPTNVFQIFLPLIGQLRMTVLDVELAPGSQPILVGREPSPALAVPVPQAAGTPLKFADAIGGLDPFRLTALHVMTTLTGSAILAFAVPERASSRDDAWTAAHVDEDFQIEQWGADAEATERRQRRWTEMEAAVRLLELMRSGTA